jgi:AcrR family transcriptional regulator
MSSTKASAKAKRAQANVEPDLKEGCVRAAHDVIAEHGVEGLSLRDVARRLGVSHQAPYKHFPSRDHLLAEIMRRCFASFAEALDARTRHEQPQLDLGSLGNAYLRYAAEHPLEYRLMFGTPWPEPSAHPAMVERAVYAFDVLRGVLRRLYGATPSKAKKVDLDAMFIWSALHGVSSITHANVMDQLQLAPKVSETASNHVMQMISRALQAAKS